MPPKSSSRRNASTPPRAPTPGRTGLRSQTPTAQASAFDSGDQSAQRELPQLQSRTSNAYGGPSRTDIARQSQIAVGTADVANIFGAALSTAIERTEDVADTKPATRRSRQPRAESEDSELSSASLSAAAPPSRNTRSSQAAAAMPTIPERRDSTPVDNTVGYDTTRLDSYAAGSFATPSRPSSVAGDSLGTAPPSHASQPLAAPQPLAAQPFGAQLSTAQTFGAQLPAAQPFGAQPFGAQPFGAQPFAAQSFAGQPLAAQPFAQLPAEQPQNIAHNQFHHQGGYVAQPFAAQPQNIARDQFQHQGGQHQLIPRAYLLRILLVLVTLSISLLLSAPQLFSGIPVLRDLSTYLEGGQYTITSLLPSVSYGNSTRDTYPWALHYRVKALEDDMASLNKAAYYQGTQLDGLMQFLPERIIMRRDEKTNQYRITPDFWKAIQAEVEGKDHSSWEHFLESNQKKLDEYFDKTFYKYSKDFKNWQSGSAAVPREEFMEILQSNFESLKTEVQRNSDAYETRLRTLEDLSASAASSEKEIHEALKNLPKLYMGNLAAINLIHNTELHLKQVNFFSPSYGALIDPFASSPTANNLTPNLPHRSFFKARKGVKPNPHIMGLEPWSEPRDCWCAAPPSDPADDIVTRQVDPNNPELWETTRGRRGAHTPRLQLGVILPQPVYPTAVTIEHFPAAGNIDSSAMPRDMEVWVQVDDPVAHAKLVNDANIAFREDHEVWRAQLPPRDPALPATYVKVGMFQYDRDGSNHVQTFDLDVSAQKRGVGVRRVIVRAASNYGGDATCLYRVRLHGNVVPVEGESL